MPVGDGAVLTRKKQSPFTINKENRETGRKRFPSKKPKSAGGFS